MTVTDAAVSPLAGAVCVPFRYFHSRKAESTAPATYSATQSVGLPGPFATVTVTVAPPATVVGVAESVGGALLVCTVIGLLVAATVYVSLTSSWTV